VTAYFHNTSYSRKFASELAEFKAEIAHMVAPTWLRSAFPESVFPTRNDVTIGKSKWHLPGRL